MIEKSFVIILLFLESCCIQHKASNSCGEVLIYSGHLRYPTFDTLVLKPFFVFDDSLVKNNSCTFYYCQNFKKDTFLIILNNSNFPSLLNKEIIVINDTTVNCKCKYPSQIITEGRRRKTHFLAQRFYYSLVNPVILQF